MSRQIIVSAFWFMAGALLTMFITQGQLRFAWSQYQLCADTLADARRTADDAAKQKLHDWARDKIVIDSAKLADAILQTTDQFNLWYYKEGNPPPIDPRHMADY